ncbi:peroxide stress protein YaaA [uncultured Alcanivorax sp.]|uniref:peroxide stress protein YaaA n=1 Tax=uncultured Alcanivorax sp. TaxID=191215 RepID=UPI00261D1C0B|nr:peroxide stress protein YaaA [uncultured Alcanivorax sp.]
MLIVVSPAKTLDYESELPALKTTQPRLLDDSEVLIERARQLSPADVSSLMSVSDKIAHLNVERFAQWQRPFNNRNARPAAFAFKGDVYTGLEIDTFTDNQLKEAQNSFRMLSGLYGVLRPLDLMQPYRLEMGTKLDKPRGKDLYPFWGDIITAQLKKDMKAAGTEVLVNLASNEYFKSVKKQSINGRIIEPVFQDEKNGKYKVISFYAKKARGLMAAWVIKKGIKDPAKLKNFDVAGYRFCAEESTADKPVFRRQEQ